MKFPFVLIDSDVIMDCLRPKTKVVFLDMLKDLIEKNQRLGITHVNIFEILAGSHPHELKENKTFLSRIPVVPIDGSSAEQAAEWYRMYRKKGQTLAIGDLLIAGIARAHDSAILTKNMKHFPMLKTKKTYRPHDIPVSLLY